VFRTISDTHADKDQRLASNAEARASVLDELPVAPICQSGLADTYGAALPG
jgi:hypothetical protein